MKIYLATQIKPDKKQGETLTKTGGQNRLMSYIYIINDKDFNLKEYIIQGKAK